MKEHEDWKGFMGDTNALERAIIGAAIRIHQKLGPGLLESVYEVILARDLMRLGCTVERQKPISFVFEGTPFEQAFIPDLIVNGLIIVEVKAAIATNAAHPRQLLTYLKILNLKRGLLLNFGMSSMKAGIHSIVN